MVCGMFHVMLILDDTLTLTSAPKVSTQLMRLHLIFFRKTTSMAKHYNKNTK